MQPGHNAHTNKNTEAAEDTSPTASASESEIINCETPAEKLWPFLGGIALGATAIIAAVIAGGIATALVVDALTYGVGTSEQPKEEKSMLALPEGGRERSG